MKQEKVPGKEDSLEIKRSEHHSTDRFVANPSVSCRTEGDGAILFNADTDTTTLINGTGLTTWHYLAQPRSLDEIASHLLASFRDTPDKSAVIRDTDTFMCALHPEYILEVDAGAGISSDR